MKNEDVVTSKISPENFIPTVALIPKFTFATTKDRNKNALFIIYINIYVVHYYYIILIVHTVWVWAVYRNARHGV